MSLRNPRANPTGANHYIAHANYQELSDDAKRVICNNVVITFPPDPKRIIRDIKRMKEDPPMGN